ncbi:MAG: sugar phosphate isomerase/epimerase family protein [Planctomycetota bacterium]
MRRRDFLRKGAAGVAGLASAPIWLEAANAKEEKEKTISQRLAGSKFKLSLAAYSFRRELSGTKPAMTLDGFIDYCAKQRLDATELTSYYFRRTDKPFLLGLRRRAYVNGLAISGTPIRSDFCFPDAAARKKDMDHVKAWIDHVALLGSQTIRIFAGKVHGGESETKAMERAVVGMREAAEYAGERGVLLALENHGGITAKVEQLLSLVRAVDSPWLGVNLDTGNFHHQVYESLEKAAPYAVAVQVKVETRENGETKKPADYRRIAEILHGANYRGYVALEYEAKEDPKLAIPRHLGELGSALAKYE